MIRRCGITLASIALLVIVVAGTASAGVLDPPRLKGTADVETTVVDQEGTINPIGSVAVREWIFQPDCAAPLGCSTILLRERVTASTFTEYQLEPVADGDGWRYKGPARLRTSCFNPDGSVVLADSMKTSETINLIPTRVNANNRVREFRGFLRINATPTQAASDLGCVPGFVKLRFENVTTLR